MYLCDALLNDKQDEALFFLEKIYYAYMRRQWLKQQKLPTHADKALEYVEKVITLVGQRMAEYPEHVAYRNMLPQLNYIQSVLTKPATDRAKLHHIDFCTGGPAGEIFKSEDPELYDAIGGVLWIADQIGRGLKMDVQVLEEFIQEFSNNHYLSAAAINCESL